MIWFTNEGHLEVTRDKDQHLFYNYYFDDIELYFMGLLGKKNPSFGLKS